MTTSPSATTGANVRAEMARIGITQTKMARVLGLSQPAISARLRGATPFDINELVQIAELLGVPIASLLPPDMADAGAAAS